MGNPIKRLRWLFGLALLGATAYVSWLLVEVDIQPAAPIVELDATESAPEAAGGGEGNSTDPLAEAPAVAERPTCLDGFRGERFESMRGLAAGRACQRKGGGWLMEQGVTFRIVGQGSVPPITVTSREGIAPEESDGSVPLILTGDVLVESEDGFRLETQELELYRLRTLVVAKQPVVFRRGDASGSAGSLEHDWTAKETLLVGAATLVLAGEELGERPITVRGARIRLLDEKGLVEVRGEGSIELDGGRVSGERIDVTVSADRKHVRRVEASGAAETLAVGSGVGLKGASIATRRLRAGRIVHLLTEDNALESIEAEASVLLSGQAVGAGGSGATELLQADWALMTFFAAKDSRLERLEARGEPARLLSESGADHREVLGRSIEMSLDADGSIRRLASAGEAKLLFRGSEGERKLSGEAVAVGLRGESIETLDFRGTPTLIEQISPGPEGPETRRVSALEGALVLGADSMPVSGSMDGSVEFSSAEHRAKGERVRIEEGGNALRLEGDAALIGPGRESHGDQVVYRRREETVAVVGDQHTIITQVEGGASLGDFVSGSEPVLISAERMDVDLATRRVVYSAPEGGNRPDIRQGDVALRGDRITMDEVLGDLTAEGSVESKLRLVKPDGRPRVEKEGLFDPTALIVGTSEQLRYRQKEQVVVYDGDVRLEQGLMSLSAEQVEVGLKGEGSQVEYLRARRRSFYEGTGFKAEGELIDYLQSENRVRVEGGRRPARAIRDGGDLATGGVLELHLDQDGILIKAPHGGRTRGMSMLQGAEPEQ